MPGSYARIFHNNLCSQALPIAAYLVVADPTILPTEILGCTMTSCIGQKILLGESTRGIMAPDNKAALSIATW